MRFSGVLFTMKKVFNIFQFGSPDFYEHLRKVALPYKGNLTPINTILKQLASPVLGCKTAIFEKEYVDEDDKYLDKINRNKQGYTTLTCECGKRFGVAYDRNGLVAFKLKEEK